MDEEQPLMAHTGRIDGLPLDDPEDQDQEPSNRPEIKMMKGLINMMKQQLRQIKRPPPTETKNWSFNTMIKKFERKN
eukprot:8262722-Prorocentrum_lima.AAC.1